MFCPKCGKADQQVDTFCRQCGIFLADFDKIESKEISSEQHLKANTILILLSTIVSLTLVILHHVFFTGRTGTPVLIHVTTGFLTAMFFWQTQTLWRTLQLKKQLAKRKADAKTFNTTPLVESARAREILNETDFSNAFPASVVENTTKLIDEKVLRKSS